MAWIVMACHGLDWPGDQDPWLNRWQGDCVVPSHGGNVDMLYGDWTIRPHCQIDCWYVPGGAKPTLVCGYVGRPGIKC